MMSGSQDAVQPAVRRPGRSLNVLAVVTAVMVFPLLFVGAGVTSKGAGMAFPDGFTADGYFLRNPPGWWDREDTRWEHGHRLLGRTVGILAIALAAGCWRYGGTLRALGVANLTAIVIQGIMGAFRVNLISTELAMLHGILGQICFCLACSVALVTGRRWHLAGAPSRIEGAVFLQRLCVIGTLLIFAQLVTGAGYRHFGGDAALLLHIFGAMAAIFVTGWTAMWVMGIRAGDGLVARLGQAIALLMVAQLLLGGAAFTVVVMGAAASEATRWAVPTAHVAVGALFLAAMVLLTMCTYQFLQPEEERSSAEVRRSKFEDRKEELRAV